ncbi:MAG: PqqD family protein [Alloprevotella sp.]
MKIKTGFELRDVCGEKVIIATGIENIDFSRMISLNESAAFLWENIQDKEFDAETLAELLLQEYEVDKDAALADSQQLVEEWKECGIIEKRKIR